MLKRFALTLFLFFAVGLLLNKTIKADGTYYNINTTTSNNGSPDSVSWSTTNPIILDSYNNLIVPTQQNGQSTYDLSFSNDKGATWNVNTNVSIPARAAVAYDAVNDTLITLSADGSNGNVTFDRFFIRRNSDYTISEFTHDYRITPLLLDDQGTCGADSAGDPVLLVKNIAGTNRVIAFWSVSKTNCGGTDITATRAAYLDISNTGTDDDVGSWHTLTGGASAGGTGPANVTFTQIYSAAVADPFYQQSALIKSSGSHINDIYYINIDTNDTHEIRRFIYNGGTGNWSSGATAPQLFGGDVNNSLGYNPKSELLSKPVESTGEDRVYAGIARWLDGINGDTQSLFYIDSSDTVSLAANVYSAGGAHCIYPTFDIGYDQVINKVYMFYDISGPSSVCGNVEYKTFSGSTLSAATPFYSVPNRSVDIPITFQNRFDGRMVLFFRLNNPVTPGVPPHEIYFGYIGSPSAPSQNGGGGAFRDDFTTPNSPYTLVFNNKWEIPASWDPGIFEPKPNGIVNLYGPQGGYLISRPKFTADQQSFEFMASLTPHNFEHIGIADSNGFFRYAIFSTSFDGILKARVADGGSETNAVIGTNFYNGFHSYIIHWTSGVADFYIDRVLVASLTTNVPTGPMSIILSDNDHSAGSDLLVDSIALVDFPLPESGQTGPTYNPGNQAGPVSTPVTTTTGTSPASFPTGTTQVSDLISDAGNSILNALQSESASKVPTILLTALGTTYTLAAGTALLSSGGAFGFNIFLDILRLIGLLPQRKKKGYVYSTLSKDPVYLARIDIKDLATNRYLGTVVTGFDGSYHIPNLQPGNYVFTAKEPTHRFPTLNPRPTGVALYDYYKGEQIAVNSNKLSEAIIIPMDSAAGIETSGNKRQRGIFFLIITRILNLLLVPSWLLSIFITITYPSAFNLVITIIYTVVIFFKVKGYLRKPALKGKIINKDNGQPIYGAIVQLKDKQGQLSGISRTSKEGYYDFFVPKENYSIYVSADGYTGEETIGSSVVQVNLENEHEKDISLKSSRAITSAFGVMG